MKRFAHYAALVLLATAAPSCQTAPKAAAPPAAADDVIGSMLATQGLTRETSRVDPDALDSLASQQSVLLPHFLRYWKKPYDFPKYVYALLDAQEANALTPDPGPALFNQFVQAQVRTGHRACTSGPNYMPELTPEKERPLQKALTDLEKFCEIPPGFGTYKDFDLPAELQVHLARLVMASKEAKRYRDRAFRRYPREKWQHAFDCAIANFAVEAEEAEEFKDAAAVNWDLGEALDVDDLYTGAGVYLKALSGLLAFLKDPKTEQGQAIDLSKSAIELETPLGKISFNGRQEDNTYAGEDYMLIIDLGGNDRYTGAAAASFKLDHPISTIVAWGNGTNTFVADEHTPCAQGAGVFGYGFLVVRGGNDTFTAKSNAQGMAYAGVGALWKEGGDCRFTGDTMVQGSAAFGMGTLVKSGGNDSYYAYYAAQGFGFIGGVGSLVDTAGGDRYVAEPLKLVRPAKNGHDNLRNYSFCQGAGLGQRGDNFGGHSMGGGIGVLQDLAGDDSYECGVFGQATAYWYGTGILHDKKGNDRYDGSFFVQSGTAHMGLSFLLDEEGDDRYHVWHAISLGGAHDFSVSYCIDKGGDDHFSSWEYKDPDGKQTLSDKGTKGQGGGVVLGSALTNSLGVFIKTGGSAVYELISNSRAATPPGTQSVIPAHVSPNVPKNSWRYPLFTAGLFINVGVKSRYQIEEVGGAPLGILPRGDSSWSYPGKDANPEKTFSMGIDLKEGRVLEALRP